MTLRVIAFVPHPRAGASGRYRVTQMTPTLREDGIEVDVRPFFDDAAFARLYLPGRATLKMLDLARGAARRWSDLARARRYDLALVHREIWPLVGEWPLERLRRHQPRWVFDFDDAVFMPNVSEANRAFARLKPIDQPRRLAIGAHVVTVGNAWLAEWARAERADRPEDQVVVVPTAVDTDRWAPRPREAGPPRIAWIGSHSTVDYLKPLLPALARLAAMHAGLELHVVGAAFQAEGIRVVSHPWEERTETALVARCDLALAPLPDSEWARGKCGLKLLLYMALGLPTVASPVGVHAEIVTHGENGLLASSPEAFEAEMDALLSDPPRRVRLGTAARHTVETRYSVRAVAPRLGAALRRAAERA